MIRFSLDVEKNEIELDSCFTSAENFADEMMVMINTIVNVTAYQGTNGDLEKGRSFAKQLKTLLAEVLDRDNAFDEFYRDQQTGE